MGLRRTMGATTRGTMVSDMTDEVLENRILLLIQKEPDQHTEESLKERLPNLMLSQFEMVHKTLIALGRIKYSAKKKLIIPKRKR